MPTDKTFDLFARRVENEMPDSYNKPKENKFKICPTCNTENTFTCKNMFRMWR